MSDQPCYACDRRWAHQYLPHVPVPYPAPEDHARVQDIIDRKQEQG